MSTTAVLAIIIPVLVVLAAAVFLTTSRRRDAERLGALSGETRRRDTKAEVAEEVAGPSGREVERSVALARRDAGLPAVVQEAELEPWTPPDEEAIGVSRRQFFNRSMIGLTGLGIAGFGASAIAFLWPQAGGGFGADIDVGSVDEVSDAIDGGSVAGFSYFPEARSYVQKYPAEFIDRARETYPSNIITGMEPIEGRDFGFTAVWQTCPHLGCRVPECATSQWFECPCHGSQYNRVGEYKTGPAPRGLDRFPVNTSNGRVVISTGTTVQGPPIGVDTTSQGLEGPHCTTGGGH
ncbi:MAG: Rieske 2Fe-2S domain-containing protein [Actinomycetota bacterium]